MSAPTLDGIHHVKLPVRDLARSREWYESRLGYRKVLEFVEDGVLRGISMLHPNGGPEVALRLAPEQAAASAAFDHFAIGVPTQQSLDDLAARLAALGEEHAGIRVATIGWILPGLHDPDGHEVRFYTTRVPESDPVAVAVASLHLMAGGTREEFDAVFAPDAVNRESVTEPPETRGRGPAAFLATSDWLRSAFSDLAWEVHATARTGDLVAVHATMSGRQTGPFVTYGPDGGVQASFPPAGGSFAVTQSHWFRVHDGQVTEHWANRDDLAMGMQLGWGPPLAEH